MPRRYVSRSSPRSEAPTKRHELWLRRRSCLIDLTGKIAVAPVKNFALVHDDGLAQPVLANVGCQTGQLFFAHEREQIGERMEL